MAGSQLPGYKGQSVRKHYVSLAGNNIGRRRGARIIYFVIPDKNLIILVIAYSKSEYNNEDAIENMWKEEVRLLDSKALSPYELDKPE